MRADVFTLFPHWFDWFRTQRHVTNALANGHALETIDPRATTPLKAGKVDDVPTPRVKEFESQLYRFLETERPAILTELGETKKMTDDLAKALDEAVDQFRLSFLA